MTISVTDVFKLNAQRGCVESSMNMFRITMGIEDLYYRISIYEQEISKRLERIKGFANEMDERKRKVLCENESKLLGVYKYLLRECNEEVRAIENDPRYSAIIKGAKERAAVRLIEKNEELTTTQVTYNRKKFSGKEYDKCVDKLKSIFDKQGTIKVSEFNEMLSLSNLEPEHAERLRDIVIYSDDGKVTGFKKDAELY